MQSIYEILEYKHPLNIKIFLPFIQMKPYAAFSGKYVDSAEGPVHLKISVCGGLTIWHAFYQKRPSSEIGAYKLLTE